MAVENWSEEAMTQLKMPPHNLDAERSLLGGLMLDNETWDLITSSVVEQDFYRPEHRIIFKAIRELASKQTPFDVVTLADALKNHQELDQAGGLAYLSELAKNTPSASNIQAYAKIVEDKALMRGLLSASSDIANRVYFPEGNSSDDILDMAESQIFSIAENKIRAQGPALVKDFMPNLTEILDKLMTSDGGITGLPTHFRDIDKITSGLQPADLLIVAGRPSMGKTVLGLNIAENVAMSSEKPVLVFSMEMPKESLVMRGISSLGRVNQADLRSGQLNDDQWSKVFSTMEMMTEQRNLYIDDTPALSPQELRSRARRLARQQGGLSLIVIDYLQLMQVPGNSESRTNEVSEISRQIKALAKELNVPIIALSQLSRKSEERTDKRPMMSDIRESGAIEQDADVIMFIYRDEVYHPDTDAKGIAEIIVAKQRNGPIGTVKLTFMGHYTRFDDYSPRRID